MRWMTDGAINDNMDVAIKIIQGLSFMAVLTSVVVGITISGVGIGV